MLYTKIEELHLNFMKIKLRKKD